MMYVIYILPITFCVRALRARNGWTRMCQRRKAAVKRVVGMTTFHKIATVRYDERNTLVFSVRCGIDRVLSLAVRKIRLSASKWPGGR